jgi:cytochrome bd-type quinol oxidase subunit 1
VIDGVAALLEGSALADHLRASRWTYPIINAGHIMGIALLVGAIVPMDLRALNMLRGPDLSALRPFAVAGLILAMACGTLLFIAQAGDYMQNGWFRAKMALLALAVANALWHLRAHPLPVRAALASLLLWPAILISGRMIGYS